MSANISEALQRLDVQALMARAALYSLLAAAFSYPDADWREDLRGLLGDLRDHDAVVGLDLQPALDALEEALLATSDEEVAAEHTRLFAGEVICSAYETEYQRDGFAKSRQLADIAGFYGAFGLKSSEGRGTPDFIATELEFMAFIVQKEAYAAVQGWEDRARVCADAQRAFLESHLGCWLPAFGRDVSAAGGDFHRAAARLAEAFVALEVGFSGARPLPPAGRSLLPDDAEAFTCGLAEASAEDDTEMIDFMYVAGGSPGRAGHAAAPAAARYDEEGSDDS